MDVEDVRAALRDIEAAKADEESAHGLEDNLYRDVVESIANGTCADPAAVCRELLKSKDIEFPRWCA